MDLDTFLRLWPVIVSLLTFAAAAGAGKYALSVLTGRIDTLASLLTDTNKTLTTMGTTVAVQTAQLGAHTEQDRIQFENLDYRLQGLGR